MAFLHASSTKIQRPNSKISANVAYIIEDELHRDIIRWGLARVKPRVLLRFEFFSWQILSICGAPFCYLLDGGQGPVEPVKDYGIKNLA